MKGTKNFFYSLVLHYLLWFMKKNFVKFCKSFQIDKSYLPAIQYISEDRALPPLLFLVTKATQAFTAISNSVSE